MECPDIYNPWLKRPKAYKPATDIDGMNAKLNQDRVKRRKQLEQHLNNKQYGEAADPREEL